MAKKVVTKKTTKEITEGLALTTVAKLNKAADQLVKKSAESAKIYNDTLAELEKVTETSTQAYQDIMEAILTKETELSELDAKLEKAITEADYTLAIEIRDSKEKALLKLVAEFNKELFDQGHVANLETKHAELINEFNMFKNKVKVDTEKTVGTAVAVNANKLKLEHAAESAVDKATISSLQSQLSNSLSQISMLEGMISSEREARVQEAQARGNSMVTVNSQK